MTSKLWGGVFTQKTDPRVEQFSESFSYDARLAEYDIIGSIAHVKMLSHCKIISTADKTKLLKGLNALLKQVTHGTAAFDPASEDIHTAVEALLKKKVGSVADKLHTARSRNDQVALDLKLYCKAQLALLGKAIRALQKTLITQADKYQTVLIPGYTHLRHAQPVSLGHHLLAYVEMFERDYGRLTDCAKRLDELPLGACALSGTTLRTDRNYLAQLLGFSRVSANSLDTVSDRDFVLELLSALSVSAVHLSRLAEEFILWSTTEFGFITLDQAFCTGSSIMPQKINPDVLELVRGRSGAMIGNLVSVLVVMKSLPLSYNRDMQYDKLPLFDSCDTMMMSLDLIKDIIGSIRVNKKACAEAVNNEALIATDIAEYLADKGIAFRKAHSIVGKLLVKAAEQEKELSALSLADYKKCSSTFDNDVFNLFNAARSVNAKASYGGTALRQVRRQIARWKKKVTKS